MFLRFYRDIYSARFLPSPTREELRTYATAVPFYSHFLHNLARTYRNLEAAGGGGWGGPGGEAGYERVKTINFGRRLLRINRLRCFQETVWSTALYFYLQDGVFPVVFFSFSKSRVLKKRVHILQLCIISTKQNCRSLWLSDCFRSRSKHADSARNAVFQNAPRRVCDIIRALTSSAPSPPHTIHRMFIFGGP